MERGELKNLLGRMTLEEKIAQLIMVDNGFFEENASATGPQVKLGLTDFEMNHLGAVYNVFGAEKIHRIQDEYLKKNRLGIPLLFCADVIYGHKTVLPIPLGYSCSWDVELIRQSMEMVADETSAAGVHAVFSPMLDLSRDPRWGRVMEGIGEDPYLGAELARAQVHGLQGDLDHRHVASCMKHFAAYGAVESGREYNAVDMSERRLRQEYLRTYQAAVEAGVKMVMPSFNTVNGIPSSANPWLLKEVLEDEWGFDGVKVSDYAAIQELVYHGFAADNEDAAKRAIECGLNFDMKTNVYAHSLQKLVEEGRVDEAVIDRAVYQILKLKNDLGLFEDPYRGTDADEEGKRLYTKHNREIAEKLASESVVLLKNDARTLPLHKTQKIALIGSVASSRALCGLWALSADVASIPTLEEAMKKKAGAGCVQYAWGVDAVDDYEFLGSMARYFQKTGHDAEEERKAALQLAGEAEVIVYTVGEHMMQSGEATSRTDLSLSEGQLSLLRELRALGKPMVVICYSGRPLLLKEVSDHCDALLQVYWPGTEGSGVIADLLYGDVNPSGKLTMSIPRNMGQIPVYYSRLKTGRPLVGSGHVGNFVSRYIDSENTPLYPFGYGLSYTEFALSDLKVSGHVLTRDGECDVTVAVTNTGACYGETVVQLYIHDESGSVARPVKELIDFKRIGLQQGETKIVRFRLREEKLRYYDARMRYVTEPGTFQLFAGLDSEECLETEIEYRESV